MKMEYSLETLLISVGAILVFALFASLFRSQIERNEVLHDYKAINGLRGLAAIFVFINHAPFMLTNLGVKNSTFSSWGQAYPNLGSFGVQVFFCITGLLFFDKVMRTPSIVWAQFFTARVRRVAPLYYFTSVVVLLIVLVCSRFHIVDRESIITIAGMLTFNFIDNPQKVGGMSLVPLSSVTWTLVHEWRFYAALPLIALAYWSRFGWQIMCVAVLLAAADLYYSAVVCWPYFLTGCLAALAMQKIKCSKGLSSLALLVAAGTFGLTLGLVEVPGYGAVRFVLTSLFFIAIIIANPRLLGAQVLNRLSDISYSIYLIHLPVLFLLYKTLALFIEFTTIDKQTFWIINFAAIPLIVMTSVFTYVNIERRFMSNSPSKHAASDTVQAGGGH